jgi:hypothetical protein
MRRSVLVVVVLLAGCPPPSQVNSFSVKPALACPGQAVVVNWDVKGRATLRTATTPDDQNDANLATVGSKGPKTVTPSSSTWFTITALDADRAKVQWQSMQEVEVPQLPVDKGDTSTCDTSGKCTVTFTLDNPGKTLQVRHLSEPKLVQSGHVMRTQICLTHAGLAPGTCVDPGATVAIAAPADGDWTLAAQLPAGADPTIPPLLQLHFDFGCP